MAVRRRSKSSGRGLTLRPIHRLHAGSVCDVQRRCSCSFRLWRYMCTSVMPLHYTFNRLNLMQWRKGLLYSKWTKTTFFSYTFVVMREKNSD